MNTPDDGLLGELPGVPDHAEIERQVTEFWDRERVFERVRSRNIDGPTFSFVDGPVTANKTLGVHTAWNRTLKDVVLRYKALRGHHQRYQNGFDCQGLWIEVGVERELGLDSKRDIEDYGLERFAARCREVVAWSARELTEGSKRLGQWMDWGNDYYTFSDSNIQYIWRFLQIVHERGWLYRGHRVAEWCPRCGTSLSAHELTGGYADREDPALTVRLPLLERPGEALTIWTTTPWTLPANVAAAVDPAAEYGRRPNGDWIAVACAPSVDFVVRRRGADLVGWRYRGPFDDLGPGAGVDHRVVAWDEVTLDEGTGIVHVAPGCGVEDFELAQSQALDVLEPIDEDGRFVAAYGPFAGRNARDVADTVTAELDARGLLVASESVEHRYPECWRCRTPLLFRVADDWFIGVDELRQPLREANRQIEWIPAYFGRRMDDWLVNMADWNISRRRYYGLPLPFYPCGCGRLTVVGSRDELLGRATGAVGDLPELHRPWVDDVMVRCTDCGEGVTRIPEVGDVWLDAGIVPFSTLGWKNPDVVPGGLGTGAAAGMTTADLPDHDHWQRWFPADLVCEMREQIRLWFYSQLFMSVTLTGRPPFRTVLGFERMLDEQGREMHGSWGNMITADEAFEQMGADVMRWQFCAQPPNRDLLFGFAAGREVARRLLTLWHSTSFLVTYARIAGFSPRYAALADPWEPSHPMDRWLVERTRLLVVEATEAYDTYRLAGVVGASEAWMDDLSNWYIRRSRRRFWDEDPDALTNLWLALAVALPVLAPVVPFRSEFLWRRLVADPCPDAPDSVFLADWPVPGPPDRDVIDRMEALRKVVDLARSARAAEHLPNRQPLSRMVVEGVDLPGALTRELADELRVDSVTLGQVEATRTRVRPILDVLGPRLGSDVQTVIRALHDDDFDLHEDGSADVAGHRLGAQEIVVERVSRPGWSVASDAGITVALDIVLDDDLRRRGRVHETIHRINRQRKERGLELTDRIAVRLPAGDRDLLEHSEWIARETLATRITIGTTDELDVRA